MTRAQAAVVRLLLICVAWAIGQVLATGVPFPGADFLVPALFAIGVYALTADLGRPGSGGGDGRYWRGRRIEDDRRGGSRWN
jgi:hypothetical protein